jgi:hypothetical protein
MSRAVEVSDLGWDEGGLSEPVATRINLGKARPGERRRNEVGVGL